MLGTAVVVVLGAVLLFGLRQTLPPTAAPARRPVHVALVLKPQMLPPKIAPKPVAAAKPSAFDEEQRMSFGQMMKRWTPLVAEASKRFGVPRTWIHAVMQIESGGRTMLGPHRPIVSSAGAMGLMQLMPSTYQDMRAQYGLGPDPFDPHDNIFAGTAYLRWLNAKYGYPQMFAAYNDGPGNLEHRLLIGGLLPVETQIYMTNITRTLGTSTPGQSWTMAKFTRPNGLPVWIDAAAARAVKEAMPDEYAPGVLSVITVGKSRQGVREDIAQVRAILRSHGGAF